MYPIRPDATKSSSGGKRVKETVALGTRWRLHFFLPLLWRFVWFCWHVDPGSCSVSERNPKPDQIRKTWPRQETTSVILYFVSGDDFAPPRQQRKKKRKIDVEEITACIYICPECHILGDMQVGPMLRNRKRCELSGISVRYI